jgi:hypothetical protein
LSLIKSIDQHSLGLLGTTSGSGSREGKRFLPLRRKLSKTTVNPINTLMVPAMPHQTQPFMDLFKTISGVVTLPFIDQTSRELS